MSKPFWFGVILRRIPEDFQDGLILAEGLPVDWEPSENNLCYAILARTLAASEADAARGIEQAVSALELIALVLVADEAKAVTRKERRATAGMEAGDVLLKSSFVGFKCDCLEAQSSAIDIISTAVLRRWWQFWR